MKCGILTFSFAHNYGAVLQTKAMKQFLQTNGLDTYVIPYVPRYMANSYSLNPLVSARSFRSRVSRLIRMPYRLKQYKMFRQYIEELYNHSTIFYEEQQLNEFVDQCDVVVCGSDQIWNDTITQNDTSYYLPDIDRSVKKISYAASFGKHNLSNNQIKCIQNFISSFQSLSLREEDGLDEVCRASFSDVHIVLDPVFLMDRRFWISEANKSQCKISEKYILFYSLGFNQELAKKTEELAHLMGMKVYAIHPTAMKLKINAKQLFNVGPNEFIYLIQNAEIVATDSFHATAFSIIFGKKYLHIKTEKENRVESLLSRVNAYHAPMVKLTNDSILDLGKIDATRLNEEIRISKSFLKTALLEG